MKFIACKHLEFDKEKYNTCELTAIMNWVCWERIAPYDGAVTLVQFCAKRGRINFPEACVKKHDAVCSLYEGVEHEVHL